LALPGRTKVATSLGAIYAKPARPKQTGALDDVADFMLGHRDMAEAVA